MECQALGGKLPVIAIAILLLTVLTVWIACVIGIVVGTTVTRRTRITIAEPVVAVLALGVSLVIIEVCVVFLYNHFTILIDGRFLCLVVDRWCCRTSQCWAVC